MRDRDETGHAPHVHESITLPPEPRAAGEARHFVADHLRDVVGTEVADVAVLLTSELVTNVIVHAGTPMRLDVDFDQADHAVRVAIADDAPRSPVRRRAGEGRMTGRGMHLVETLSSDWGVEPCGLGKTVWFELPA
jgi:anti-sigma regulatory factor (Ser/Thr protein kinase)